MTGRSGLSRACLACATALVSMRRRSAARSALCSTVADDKVGAGGIADDPGFSRMHARVGFDFLAHRLGECAAGKGAASRGAVSGEPDVAGSVGGEQQHDQPAQRKSGQQYGGQRHDEP